jgi:CHASE2 domain-containing sensor protein
VMFRLRPPVAAVKTHSIILAIDDATFNSMGGVGGYRAMWTQAFELIQHAKPKAAALDVVLSDPWKDPAEDQRLGHAMQAIPNLVLATHLDNGRWEDPLPIFRQHAAAIGHDGADELSADGVTREIPLEERTATERHWSLALEAFRLAKGAPVLESPNDLQIGSEVIPAARSGSIGRPLRILYTREPIPSVSLKDLVDNPQLAARFNGQVVFIGVTSISATYDRVATPYGQGRIPGVEVHAQLFETLERGRFLTDASNLSVLGLCVLVAALAGLYRGCSLAGGRAHHPVPLFPPRHRVSVLRAFRFGLANGHRRRQLPALCRKTRAARCPNRAPALPAGHSLRHA